MDGKKYNPRKFLDHAEIYLEKKNFVQCGEKCWLAATWALQIFAGARGFLIHSHKANKLLVTFIADNYIEEDEQWEKFWRGFTSAEE